MNSTLTTNNSFVPKAPASTGKLGSQNGGSPNRYPGTCADCGASVAADAGTIERNPRARLKRDRWIVRCRPCIDKNDHSGVEDRACGDRAYEDACAQACGL